MRNIVLFVALESELHADAITDPRVTVVYTGVGKMAAATAYLEAYTKGLIKPDTLILNAGTCGSTSFKPGTLIYPNEFINGGCEYVRHTICFSYLSEITDPDHYHGTAYTSDEFVSEATLGKERTDAIKELADVIDMESYAIANFASHLANEFAAIKIVSDNLDGTMQDWDAAVESLRPKLEDAVNEYIAKH